MYSMVIDQMGRLRQICPGFHVPSHIDPLLFSRTDINHFRQLLKNIQTMAKGPVDVKTYMTN